MLSKDVRHFDAETIRKTLSYDAAIKAVRRAMLALSDGSARQNLRSFIALENKTFALMPAALSPSGYFGAKLVAVFAKDGQRMHKGLVVLFDGASGEPLCTADAEEITHIRTGAASAVATEVLARPDAHVMALLGAGAQADSHIRAIAEVRELKDVIVWSRDFDKASAFAAEQSRITGLAIHAARTAREAVADADIVCTVTSAAEPVLEYAWLKPGTHVNVVGSSAPGPVEIDQELVVRSRFIADHREHVLVHGAEFLRAKAAGAVTDAHVVAEIGEVLAGKKPGRTSPEEITVYKSLGHAVQDIASTAWVYERAT